MALFQKSVLKKYLADLNKEQLQQAWQVYKAHFHNPTIQENIRNAKEEEYQEGFVRDLFVEVLGYTLKPQPDFDFVLEKKTETDATKSDGALLRGENIIGVLELKDTETTELDKIEKQVFGYKHKHKNCVYVITSNFEKLRFYINDATDYEDFDLFRLTEDRFALMWLCLQQKNIGSDLPLKIKQASLSVEESVTQKLYTDYSQFKRRLFTNLTELNPQYNKLELFKKTQKLLDRFLFILFAEDRLLLPPNSVREILNQWEQLKDLDNYVPLYSRYKLYFGYLNTGHEGKHHEIFAYNGGLFAPDEILDNIKIDDTVLYDGTKQLSGYDFETEVDVNILGHIFEHSLSEIEEVQAQIEGSAVEKAKTKRKKDGVFYTPRYITKYIVENTVGQLCRQKKEELNITDEEFAYRRRKDSREKLSKQLDYYRNWLFKLTICDPACGSGAFLNQALEFLIAEHRYIDELKAKLFGDSFVLSDVETTILENNLYGVDINEEAVEIARLSLWLRTAKKGRKLNDLSKRIKCGNSLIDDNSMAGEKAFNWKNEFPIVSLKGGFNVILGNPPYVDIKSLPTNIVNYIFEKFATANNRVNLFSVFIEKSLSILGPEGYFSFIIPSAILTQDSYKPLRKHLLETVTLKSIVRLPNESFGGGAGEVKVDTVILTFNFSKKRNSLIELLIYKGFDRINEISSTNSDIHAFVDQETWTEDKESIFRLNADESVQDLIKKIERNSIKLAECADISLGITPYDKYRGHTKEQIENRAFHSGFKKDETFQKLLAGNDVRRYDVSWNGEEWLSYGNWLGAPRDKKFFTEKRILIKQIIDWTSKRIWCALTEEELYNTQNAFNIIPHKDYFPEYIIAILNSRLITFYHRKKYLEEFKDRFQKILIKDCKDFPIKPASNEIQSAYLPLVSRIQITYKELQNIKEQFQKLLTSKFDGLRLSKKLEDWPSISFKDFLKELSKQKVKISLAEEAEWMQYFEEQKDIANNIQQVIDRTDKEIDQMVYNLYGLTEEEIKIVEG